MLPAALLTLAFGSGDILSGGCMDAVTSAGTARALKAWSQRRRQGWKPRPSGKGSLLKWMSPRLSRKILHDPAYRDILRETMHRSHGVYALYQGSRLYYVGLSTNLLERVKWHRNDGHSKKWDHFVVFQVRRVPYLKDVETLLLHVLDLPGNRVRGRLPKIDDLGRAFARIVRKHKSLGGKAGRASRTRTRASEPNPPLQPPGFAGA